MEVNEQHTQHAVEEVPVAPAPYPPPPPRAAEPAAPYASPTPGAPQSPAGGRYLHSSYTTSSMPVGYRARQIVWLAYGIVAAFLILDLIFHAAGANTSASFVRFVYNVGGAFNMPFRNIITGERPGVSTIEWADVIALVVYAFAAWVVERIIIIMRSPSRPPTYGAPY